MGFYWKDARTEGTLEPKEKWHIQATGGEGWGQAQEQLEPAMRKVAGPSLHLSQNVDFALLFCSGLAFVQSRKYG